jgi:hypothetical protein
MFYSPQQENPDLDQNDNFKPFGEHSPVEAVELLP